MQTLEPREMTIDAELLDEIFNEGLLCHEGRPITPKRVSQWSGKSLQTISDYRNGKINVPGSFWSFITEHTDDLRFLKITHRRRRLLVSFADNLPDIGDEPKALQLALEQLTRFHKAQEHLTAILADGRVDESDARSLREYNGAYQSMINAAQQAHRVVNAAYDKAIIGRGRKCSA